jgi:plastocyanin
MVGRKLRLVLAGILGGALAIVPGLATGDASPSASFTAVDFAWNASGGGNQVTIPQGGTVSFAYPSGASTHNADFSGGRPPTSCSQTTGASSGSVPPLPAQPTAAGWSGTCTFDTPGTYTFHCDLHPFMTGTIVVPGAGTTTTTTTTTTTSTTSPPTTTATTTTTSPAAPTPPTISISHRQRGAAVAGVVKIAGSDGSEPLEVDLLVPAHALGLHGHGLLRVGRLVRRQLTPGTSRFSILLSGRARRALRERRGLTVTVKVVVGVLRPRTFTVLLRP